MWKHRVEASEDVGPCRRPDGEDHQFEHKNKRVTSVREHPTNIWNHRKAARSEDPEEKAAGRRSEEKVALKSSLLPAFISVSKPNAASFSSTRASPRQRRGKAVLFFILLFFSSSCVINAGQQRDADRHPEELLLAPESSSWMWVFQASSHSHPSFTPLRVSPRLSGCFSRPHISQSESSYPRTAAFA